MKSPRDYLDLDDTERKLLEALDVMPKEAADLFRKLIMGPRNEFDKTYAELEALVDKLGLRK